MTSGAGEERGTTLRGLVIQAGRMLGAASVCPGIAPARVDGIAAKIAAMIKSEASGSGERPAAILDVLAKSEAEGAHSVATKEIDCATAGRQLADLENISTPAAPNEPSAPGAPQPAVSSGQAAVARGVTANEIRFGLSAPLSGPAKQLGQQMMIGIETAFDSVNDEGGVHGRMLRLVAADDGYEPERTALVIKGLYEKDRIFGFIGNVGTPTAVVSLPFALQHHMLFYGAFTGAGFLRRDPPDRYVFNYRASYAEETAAVVHYLVSIRKIKPDQIAVFAQEDSYGDAGFAGVMSAMRMLRGGDGGYVLRIGYPRNTIDVENAIMQLKAHKTPIKAVVMVAAYRAAAKFIEKTHDVYPGLVYTNVSFVGSTALKDELMLLGPEYLSNVIVTQVVPAVDGYSTLVLQYKTALARYFAGEAPDYVSFEGYVAAEVLIEALKRAGAQLDTEKLVDTLEKMHGFDLGLGAPISFGRSDHQGLHKVWGTQLNELGQYEPVDLQ